MSSRQPAQDNSVHATLPRLASAFVRRACGTDDTGDPQARTAYGQFASIAGILANIVLSLAKGLVGLLAGSISIIADAVNNLTDAVSSIVSLAGFKLASKPADAGHPFGHGRYEYVAGLTVSILIIVVGTELVRTSIERIVSPEVVAFGPAVIVVLLLSIAAKLWLMRFNARMGRAISSETLQAVAIDARNDAISTASVLACAFISHITGIALDGWAGLAVGVFIIVSGALLVRDTVNPLIGSAPDADLIEHIRSTILSHPGVIGVHDIMVHDYGPTQRFVSAHVEMPPNLDVVAGHEVLDSIEQAFADEHLLITLHLDPVERKQ